MDLISKGMNLQNKKIFIITGVGKANSLGSLVAYAIKDKIESAYVIAICQPGLAPEYGNDCCDAFFTCDLSNWKQVQSLFDAIAEQHPEIYALINCAGMNKMDWFPDIDWLDLEKVMNVNCYSTLWITHALLPSLSGGTVLNIISMGAHKPFSTSLAYNISKAALLMATKQLARELKKTHDITVFGISPNELNQTGMTLDNKAEIMRIRGWDEAKLDADIAASQGKRTSPERLADFIAYLMTGPENHKHFNGVDIFYGD